MWCMARRTSVSFNGRVLVDKRSLLIGVTFNTSRIGSSREPSLFQFKTAMWVVAVTALHRSFENFMMEGHLELVLGFAVAVHAELRLTRFQ